MISGLNPSSQQLLNGINNAQADLNRAQQQVSSGLRITRPSDDPQLIGDVLQTRSDLAQVTQVSGNLKSVKSEVDTADGVLQNAVQLMEQAGVYAAQGNNTSLDAGAREILAKQVDGILQQIVTISRTQVNGQYIFSGDDTATPPYALDSSGAVTQLSTSPATRLIQDASGLTFAASKTAQELFDGSGGNSVFAALQGLKSALLANDPAAIQTAADTVNTASGYLNNEAGFYGAVQNRVSAALDIAQKFQTQDQARLSTEQDADIAAAALQITQDTTHINAALATAAKQITTSLFDYIR